MAPILGIWASGATPSKQNSFESIATTTVGAGGASSVTFSSIPSTYTHLQIRCFNQQTLSRPYYLRFNSAGGTAYADHYFYGDGASVGAGNGSSNSYIRIGVNSGTTAATDTNMFSSQVIDVLDYQNTNKYKTTRTLLGTDTNGGTNRGVEFSSGLWQSTSAVTQIDLIAGGTTFSQYSSFALYGIRG